MVTTYGHHLARSRDQHYSINDNNIMVTDKGKVQKGMTDTDTLYVIFIHVINLDFIGLQVTTWAATCRIVYE